MINHKFPSKGFLKPIIESHVIISSLGAFHSLTTDHLVVAETIGYFLLPIYNLFVFIKCRLKLDIFINVKTAVYTK